VVESLVRNAIINHKPRMPFRVLGLDLDLIDLAGVCYLLAPSSPERAFKKGAKMLGLTDRSTLTELASPPGGLALPPLHEPESLERTPRTSPQKGATVMTSEELAEAGSAATPLAPKLDRLGIASLTSPVGLC